MQRKSDHIFDELLILRCQDRDQQACNLLWKRWQPKVLKWSFDFIRDQELAHEIAQESWLSIFRNISKLKNPSLFRFWAYRIVQRRSADWIRKEQKKRAGLEVLQQEAEPEAEETASAEPDPVDVMLKAIKELPESHQRILRMFYLEKTPVKLMAKTLGIPEGTIKSRLYHAREQLKKQLKNRNHE